MVKTDGPLLGLSVRRHTYKHCGSFWALSGIPKATYFTGVDVYALM
jgi:hypothetical protein